MVFGNQTATEGYKEQILHAITNRTVGN